METLKFLSENLEIIFKNFLFSLGIILLSYILFSWIVNFIIKYRYKREKNENDKKYMAQRCYEEGFGYDKDGKIIMSKIEKQKDKNKNEIDVDINDEDNRNNIYLVDHENKRFYRITDLYTLGQLGYPRPSRKAKKSFKLSDGYTIGNQIKIRNIISEISEIKKLKD